MPRRKIPLITGQVYHVFNRGLSKQDIFFTPKHYLRALNIIRYYLVFKPPLPYSKFIKLPKDIRKEIKNDMNKMEKGVDIISYVLMPNHFHFLVKQLKDKAIMEFTKNFQISITKYINKRYERSGPLLQGQFKNILIEDDEQLLHVHRYIHLNPYTSFLVKDLVDLCNYPWSSQQEFIGLIKNGFCRKDMILYNFKDINKYRKFIINHADYQRSLETIKHLVID